MPDPASPFRAYRWCAGVGGSDLYNWFPVTARAHTHARTHTHTHTHTHTRTYTRTRTHARRYAKHVHCFNHRQRDFHWDQVVAEVIGIAQQKVKTMTKDAEDGAFTFAGLKNRELT